MFYRVLMGDSSALLCVVFKDGLNGAGWVTVVSLDVCV